MPLRRRPSPKSSQKAHARHMYCSRKQVSQSLLGGYSQYVSAVCLWRKYRALIHSRKKSLVVEILLSVLAVRASSSTTLTFTGVPIPIAEMTCNIRSPVWNNYNGNDGEWPARSCLSVTEAFWTRIDTPFHHHPRSPSLLPDFAAPREHI